MSNTLFSRCLTRWFLHKNTFPSIFYTFFSLSNTCLTLWLLHSKLRPRPRSLSTGTTVWERVRTQRGRCLRAKYGRFYMFFFLPVNFFFFFFQGKYFATLVFLTSSSLATYFLGHLCNGGPLQDRRQSQESVCDHGN